MQNEKTKIVPKEIFDDCFRTINNSGLPQAEKDKQIDNIKKTGLGIGSQDRTKGMHFIPFSFYHIPEIEL
jgi:hypothetical protein